MKQTAVEWLVENLNLDETSPNYNKLTIEKAKAMEEEQLEDFLCMGILNSGEDGLSFNECYNEIFKSK